MASLLRGIKNFFRGKAEKAAEALADPVRDGKFAIEDAQKQIDAYRQKIGEFSGKIKVQERKLVVAKGDIDKWTSLATVAAQKQDADSAKIALMEKNKAVKEVSVLEAELTQNKAVLNNTKTQLQQMVDKVGNAESNFDQLKIRKESAELRKEMSGVGMDGKPFAELDSLQEAVDKSECQAEAFEEVTQTGQGAASVEAKYGNNGSTEVDAELAELMAKHKAS